MSIIKIFSDNIITWAKNRDQLYQWVTSIAAALIVASLVVGERPSRILANVFHWLGATSVGNWFDVNAPPIFTDSNPRVQEAILFGILVPFAVMIWTPIRRGLLKETSLLKGWDHLLYELALFLDAPAASTVWILALIATQHATVIPTRQHCLKIVLWVQISLFFAIVIGATLHLIRSRTARDSPLQTGGNGIKSAVFPSFVICMFPFFSIALAGIAVPVSIIRWGCAAESDGTRRVRKEMEKLRLDREPLPSGAVPRR